MSSSPRLISTLVHAALLSLFAAMTALSGSAVAFTPTINSALSAQEEASIVAAVRFHEVRSIAAELEAVAEELRRIRPAGTPSPSLASVHNGRADAAPGTLARRIIERVDALGDLQALITEDWQQDIAAMATQRMPAESIARQHALLDEALQRSAQFLALLDALRHQLNHGDSLGLSEALIDLADLLAGYEQARGWQAIDAAALPIQGSRAEDTPAPGSNEDEAGRNSISDPTLPPGSAELAATLDAPHSADIVALATELGNDPVQIRNWVYNHIVFDPTWGSIQGAELTLLNRRGNATDIASLTIALLRSAGIPARYARSVVELRSEQVLNWLDDIASPEMALELMQKGGIPASPVIAAGRIQAIRFEHVWVEAWVDFIPSRGAINREPDTWVPIDVAFKQYEYQRAYPWQRNTLLQRQQLFGSIFADMSLVPSTGALSGFDLNAFDEGMQQIAVDLAQAMIDAGPANDRVRLYGQRAIRTVDSPFLEGALPYPLRSSTVHRYSEVPSSLRHALRIQFYLDAASVSAQIPARELMLPTVRLGSGRLRMDYAPASAADAAALAGYAEANAASMMLGSINLIPRLMLDDEVLFETGAARMGTQHYWRLDMRDAHGQSASSEPYRFAAGSPIAFVANLSSTSAHRVERETAHLPDIAVLPVDEVLYYGGLLYWSMSDHLNDQAARAVDGRTLSLPSIGAFAQPLQVRYFFGLPRTGFTLGRVTDIKSSRFALTVPASSDRVGIAAKFGAGGSLPEGAVWALLSGAEQETVGLSAASLLAQAIDDGQRIFHITLGNVNAALNELQLSVDAKNEIRQSAQAGHTVVAHEREIHYRGWSGAGYVVINPQTGASLQRIEGGFAGGIEVGCVAQAISLTELARLRMLRLNTAFLTNALGDGGGLIDVAMAALNAMYAADSPVEGAVLPTIAAAALSLSISFSSVEVNRWLRGIIDGWEELTPEEMEILGLDSINDVACTSMSPCEPDNGGGGFQGGGSNSGVGGPTVANPVAVGTGAKWQRETDYRGSGPFPLQFQRSYVSSAPRLGGRIGAKWTASYFQSVRLPPTLNGSPFPASEAPNQVMLTRPNGSWYQFDRRGEDYLADPNVPGRLARITNNGNTVGWTYTTREDIVERYSARGRLLSVQNRAGLRHTLHYSAGGRLQQVSDDFGRSLSFEYHAETGVLTRLNAPEGYSVGYTHDNLGNLIRAEYPEARTRQYHYENLAYRFQLTAITDELGIRVGEWRYDHRGRVRSYQQPEGVNRHQFAYENNLTRVVDPLGTEREYRYTRIFGRPHLIEVTQPCTSCGSSQVAELSYTSSGWLASQTDFKGTTTRYQRDARGLVTQQTEAHSTPLSRTRSAIWHPDWHLPTQITEPLASGTRVSTFEYDSQGNLERLTVTADGESRVWTWTYNTHGQVLTEDGPRSDVEDITTYTYHTDGTLATVTDPLGHTWQFTHYNAHGQVLRSVDPNGLITLYGYDSRLRLTSISQGDEETRYTYDNAGLIERINLADDSYIEYSWDDAGRLSSMADALGNRRVYTLDPQGNRIGESTYDPDEELVQTLSRVIDALGRVEFLLGAENQRTRLDYDDNGNLERVENPLEFASQYQYDRLNRQVLSVDPDNGEITLNYDPQNNLTQVIDPRQLSTTYQYNGFDELIRLTSPDTGITSYTHDAAGNLRTQTDARNVTSTHHYDAGNRLTRIDYPAHEGEAAQSLNFTYDDTSDDNAGRGRLTAASSVDAQVQLIYDRHGRALSRTQTVTGGSARQLRSEYDPETGQHSADILPSGARIDYAYGIDGRPSAIQVNGITMIDSIRYQPFGPLASWTLGSANLSVERGFDLDGRMTEHSLGSSTRELSYDDASRITAIADEDGSFQWQYDYDRLDRLKSADSTATAGPLAGLELAWEFDPTGNRTRETRNSNVLDYLIDPASNRLQGVGSETRLYDNVGNTLNDGAGTISRYDARNRLRETTRAGLTTRYGYNAFGQRVSKTADGATTEYVYNDNGQLVGEYSQQPGASMEVIWLGDTPIAVLKPRPGASNGSATGGGSNTPWGGETAGGVDVYFIHTDQLNTPRAIVNSTGQTIWRWDSAPFGDNEANEAPTAGIAAFRFNLRFPGQQYDAETGLHYNYFRDYEPGTGRYVQSDPIGLGGGINTFAYVGSQPLMAFDPTGEAVPLLLAPLVCTGGGCQALTAAGAYCLTALAGIGIGITIYNVASSEDIEADKDELRDRYHRACDRKPPEGLDRCERARWEYRQTQKCFDLRNEWEQRFGPLPQHQGQLQQVRNRLRNAADAIRIYCCESCQ